jgi:dolichyl-phosphate beta-glucosyltransferase
MRGESLSLVIPAYNEEKRIGPTLRKVFAFLDAQDYPAEVILVDDGSSDSTAEVAQEAAAGRGNFRILKNGVNRGKGFSVKNGMLNAKHEIVLFSDADLSTPIEEANRFIEYIMEGCDVVIGSRTMRRAGVVIEQRLHRRLMGRVFNLFVRALAVRGFSDTQCGFKAFTRDAARRIFGMTRIRRFAFDVEMLFLAKRLGFKVKELPVAWHESSGSSVRPLRDSSRMFAALFSIRLNALFGRYKESPPRS